MRVSCILQLSIICLALFSAALRADDVRYEVTGVADPMLTNVVNHVSSFRISSNAKLNARLRRKLVEDTKASSINAMRPYGYFHPVVVVNISPDKPGKWLVKVNIKPGLPVNIESLDIELSGPGEELVDLQQWRTDFPLSEGQTLNQQFWDKAKQDALDILESSGFLNAAFTRHSIRVDTVANSARLELTLDTGPQAVIGTVAFKQDILSEGILASLQRFESGDAYNAWLLGKFRLDLWRSGYFEDIRVIERRRLSQVPPRVDLEVELKPRKKNTYQGSVGFGTDTLMRLQFLWGRHLLNKRGDNFDIGFGWQQKDNEFTFQTNYRIPRETKTKQFWVASLAFKSEQQTLKVALDGDLENQRDLAKGNFNDYAFRFGKTRARNLKGGYEQLFETVFVQYLRENHDFKLREEFEPSWAEFGLNNDIDKLLGNINNSLTFGIDWDWPEIRGRGFRTYGHHERAWIFTSNEAWGSDTDFSQVYLSSRFNIMAGDDWKFLLRAEVGYSDAKVSDFNFSPEEGEINISSTELPYFYRFKAGGSRSVRGYGFEQLDNNGLGSNNVLTASAEVEYHFHEDWSLAAFADIGNAFNDWSKPALKLGTGVGVRWYSVIGALRLDVAKGWDLAGEPWRIHLTIGTPLL